MLRFLRSPRFSVLALLTVALFVWAANTPVGYAQTPEGEPQQDEASQTPVMTQRRPAAAMGTTS